MHGGVDFLTGLGLTRRASAAPMQKSAYAAVELVNAHIRKPNKNHTLPTHPLLGKATPGIQDGRAVEDSLKLVFCETLSVLPKALTG